MLKTCQADEQVHASDPTTLPAMKLRRPTEPAVQDVTERNVENVARNHPTRFLISPSSRASDLFRISIFGFRISSSFTNPSDFRSSLSPLASVKTPSGFIRVHPWFLSPPLQRFNPLTLQRFLQTSSPVATR